MDGSVAVHLPSNIRPELFEFVGHGIPHHFRDPPCQGRRRRVVFGVVVKFDTAAATALPPIPDRLNCVWPERLLVMRVRLAAYAARCQTVPLRSSKYRGSCLSN